MPRQTTLIDSPVPRWMIPFPSTPFGLGEVLVLRHQRLRATPIPLHVATLLRMQDYFPLCWGVNTAAHQGVRESDPYLLTQTKQCSHLGSLQPVSIKDACRVS